MIIPLICSHRLERRELEEVVEEGEVADHLVVVEEVALLEEMELSVVVDLHLMTAQEV